jgi:hypothetical protein
MAGKPFLHHKFLPLSSSPIIKLLMNESFIIYPRGGLTLRFPLRSRVKVFQGQGADGIKTLSRHVQRALRAHWHGYLPPGSCLVTSLPGASDIEDTGAGAGAGNPFGASCIAVLPTMRYPVDVRWHQDLVYNAVWSLLVEVGRWNAERNSTSAQDATETKTTRRRRSRRTIQTLCTRRRTRIC